MPCTTSKMMYGLSGAGRWMLYEFAANTGFRASECARITVADLHLDGDYPHVRLAAPDTENREEARIILAIWASSNV